jgi:hypothetical protein
MIAKIRAEGLERSEVAALYDHLNTVLGPRLTGTPALKGAAEWARDRLAGWGASDPRLETWDFGRGWELDGFALEMITPRYMPLTAYPEAWSASTRGVVEATPVVTGGRAFDDVKAMSGRLAGALVMSQPIETRFYREDRPQPSEQGSAPAAEAATPRRPTGPTARDWQALYHGAGVGAILKPSRGEHGTMFVLGRDAGDEAVPSIVVMAEQYNMIVRMIEDGVPVTLRARVDARYLDADTNGYNVVAEIPGTDPAIVDEVVMIGAHLDSWHAATGGTDNADGVAVALEAIRILKALGVRPRRTIRVALWSGEEQGLLGSARWVERHLQGDANREAHEKFSVYFNIDNGYGPIYGFYAEGNAAAKRIFDAWLAPFTDLGARYNTMDPVGSTDHVSFIRAGVPGFNPIQDYTDYDVRTHHTNADNWERVDRETLKEAAVVYASFLYHAAMRDERMPRVGTTK